MANIFEVAQGNKTYITLVITIIGSIAAYFMGELSLSQAIYAVIGALSGIFIRSGINTTVANHTAKIADKVDAAIAASPPNAATKSDLDKAVDSIIGGK